MSSLIPNALSKRPVSVTVLALAVIAMSIAVVAHSLFTSGLLDWMPDQSPPPAALPGNIADHGTHLVYVPDGVSSDRKNRLMFALSPSGDALSMIMKWHKVADKHSWILAASKESRNGLPFDVGLPLIEAELRAVEREYPVDSGKVIFTGLSGGGMASHAFAKFYPHFVSAVVINTGMMEESFMTAEYPERKLAVFLASPTDFRYNEMQRDRAFLVSHQWKTEWIEFSGGHVLAPDNVCEQAAQWLEGNLH
jgi:predicted esterase